MKNLIFIFILLISLNLSAQVTETTVNASEIAYTATDSITKSGKKYVLHTGSRGGVYIIRVSSKSGNTYKQYIKKEELAKLN